MEQEKCGRGRKIAMDTGITVLIILAAVLLCNIFRIDNVTQGYASPVFVLAVLMISRLTEGYVYGLAASVLGVFVVNFMFTYPYYAFNFTATGYPLTFVVLLGVSIVTSTLTTQLKQRDMLKLENERVKMQANLLRSISHDIRTPLTSINGAASAILENQDITETQKQELLRDVRNEAQWLIRVVENLLSVTRVGTGQTKMNIEPWDAEEVVFEAIQKFHRHYPGVSVEADLENDLPFIPMEPLLIERVLINLMENAAVHGGNISGICISVKERKTVFRFRVSDDGRGFPPEKLKNAFDGAGEISADVRSDGTRNMGLGLSVCKAIIQAHEGTIWAENNREGGASVCFDLPRKPEEEPAATASSAAPAEPTEPGR